MKRILVGALLALTPSLPLRAGALEDAATRELALLAQEREALLRDKEELESRRSARAAALRAEIGQIEARLTAALAAERALTHEVERSAALRPRSAEDDAALERVVRAAQAVSRGEPVGSLGAALQVGVRRAREGAASERIDTGFFSADGTFVDGAVLKLGAVAAVAVSGASAGPAWRMAGGTFEVATSAPPFAEAARLLLTSGDAPMVPLALGPAPARADAALGFWAVTRRAGVPALVALALSALALLLAAARVAFVWRSWRGARRLPARVAALVLGGELGHAAAECRKVGGPVGRMLLEIVERARSAPGQLERVEERASDAFLDASLTLERGAVWTYALLGLSATVALGGSLALARVAAVASQPSASLWLETLVPVERAMWLGAPAALFTLVAYTVTRRVRVELERAMVRVVDAVAHAGREVQ